MSGGTSLNIYSYNDYRAYLRDFYSEKKQTSPSFSYRSFALSAKISSPNYLKLVIDGHRRVTDKYLENFVRGLRLEKYEAEYFKALVRYTDSKHCTENRRVHMEQMIRLRARTQKKASVVDGSMTEFLNHWYVCVVRELTLTPDFSPDPKWISNRMGGRISPKQAKEAMECLAKLGMIEVGTDGRYQPREALLTTGDEGEHKLIVRRLHHQFASLAAASILQCPPEDRETSGLTIALPKKNLALVKNLIREFRQNLNRVLTNQDGNDEVYHLAINFFPLSGRSQK